MERQIRRGRRRSRNRLRCKGTRRADCRFQSRRHARHPADRPRLERHAVRNLGAKNGDGPPLPMGNWSEIKLIEPNPNRNAVGAKNLGQDGDPHPAALRRLRAAATPRAMRALFMSASAPRSGRKSGCNGRTANRAPATACSPTSLWSSTAPKPQAAYWYPGR